MNSDFGFGFLTGLNICATVFSFYMAKRVSGQANPLGVLLVLCRRNKYLRWAATSKDDSYLEKLDAEMMRRANAELDGLVRF